ncbi:MAG TPA: methylated-DNA--[protein]-cysteine S-methyltransferase [Acidimicrobiales bacterium]
MTTIRYTTVPSPVGELLLVAGAAGLRGLYLDRPAKDVEPSWRRDPGRFAEERAQLKAYFGRELKDFAVALDLDGTPFQLEVWTALQTIPYGSTFGYGQLAVQIGRSTAARAVGGATGRNPVSIIVPCHRLVGVGGRLTGYAYGLGRKRALLDLEAGVLQQ